MAYIKYGKDYYEGEALNGKPHGKGIYYYANGARSVGEWKNGRLNGKGAVYDVDGSKIYDGEWKNGRFNGKGILYHPNGLKLYDGELINGQMHGKGILYRSNGAIGYDGEFVQGKQHGKGVFYYKDGDKYVGMWEQGELHGKGTYYWADGDCYDGYWSHSKKHGKGTWYFANGSKRSVEYKNDEIVGKGELIKKSFCNEMALAQDNPTITTETKSSTTKPHSKPKKKRTIRPKGERVKGAQTIEYPDGSRYVGEVKKGKRHGIGTIYYASGDQYYDGEWKKDEIHGEGIMYFTENVSFRNCDGSEIKFKKGSRIKGIWKNLRYGKKLTLILPGGTKKKIRLRRGTFKILK